MGGLIPLLLPASSGNSSRPRDSLNPIQRPVSVMASRSPTTTNHRRQQSLPTTKPTVKRLSVASAPQLPMPDNAADWRNTISEVKRKFVSRKYRSCSARCCEILGSLQDTSNIDTIYLVYLHFYAASSLEMSARPLSQSSAHRNTLLRDAQEHYQQASELVQKAEEAAVQKTRPESTISSLDLSLQSPSLSDSSHEGASVFTAASSPRNSVSSVESLKDLDESRKQPKKKKKVSFSGLPETIEFELQQPEPYIRPDSPTLGWEENYLLFGQPESIPDYALSKPLLSTLAAEPKRVEAPSVAPPPPPTHKRTPSALKQPPPPPVLKPVMEEKQDGLFDLESFLQIKSMNRIVGQFSALRSQIAYHRDEVESLLAQTSDIPETPDVPDVPVLTHSRAGSVASVSGEEDQEHISPSQVSSTLLSPHTLERALSQRLKDAFGSSASFDLTLTFPSSSTPSEASSASRRASIASQRTSISPSPCYSPAAATFPPDVGSQTQQHPQAATIPEETNATLTTGAAPPPWDRRRNSSLPGGTVIPPWTRNRSSSLAAGIPWSQHGYGASIAEGIMHPHGGLMPEPWDRVRSGSLASISSVSNYTGTRPPSAASSTTSHGSFYRGGDEALQSRIERLRANGWQRKRFDSRRYEALREQVLNELDTP